MPRRAAAADARIERSKLLKPQTPSTPSKVEGEAGDHAVSVHPVADGVSGEVQRKLGVFAVAVVLFSSVAGGPYGIEAAVGAAGALPVLIGTVVLAIAWSATQALVSAELATAFPSNGGAVTWGVEGLGPLLGFVNAANSIASALCNLPLYPVMFASYIQNLLPGISAGALWAIQLGGLVLTVGLNVLGIEAVSVAGTVFSVLVQTPFILMPIVAAVKGMPFTWSAVTSVVPSWQANFSVFVSTLCWNAIVSPECRCGATHRFRRRCDSACRCRVPSCALQHLLLLLQLSCLTPVHYTACCLCPFRSRLSPAGLGQHRQRGL